MSFPKQLHCDMIFLKSLAKMELWFYGFWLFRNMVFRFGLRRSSRKGNLKHDIFCVISKDNVPFSCEYVITFWLTMKDDLPLKNTLKVDISCIIGSVDTLPKKIDVTLYIGKLKRIFFDKWYCFGSKTLPKKEFSFGSEAVVWTKKSNSKLRGSTLLTPRVPLIFKTMHEF